MINVSISKAEDGSLSFDVYRKPTHTDQYIPFHSHAPLSHKLATIRSLTRRASLIPSSGEKKEEENKKRGRKKKKRGRKKKKYISIHNSTR